MFAVAPPPPQPPAAVATAPAAHATTGRGPSGASSPASPALAAAPQVVTAHGYHYRVIGNHLLDAATVQQALAKGKTARKAIAALKQAYMDAGYFLVALVGRVQGHNVDLRVIQGRITHVKGPSWLAAFFHGIKGNDRVRKSDILRRSVLLQAYAATNGEKPQLSFKPAPEAGGSTLHISRVPLEHHHWWGASLAVGNYGNRYAGRYLAQAQVSASHAGMTLQLDHTRALTGMSPDTHGAYYMANGGNFSWITPLGIFAADARVTHYRLGQRFAPLFPGGRIQTYGASATQLLHADSLRRWSVHEGIHHIRDRGTVFSGAFVLHDRRFSVVNIGSDFSQRLAGLFGHALAVGLSAEVKLGYAGANKGFTNRTGSPASHFQIYTANASFTQSLAHGVSAKLSLSGQATPQTLPSYEQCMLGGVNNLSTYLPGTLTGDRGYLGRLSVQGPLRSLGPLRLRAGVFVEQGAARFSFVPADSPTWKGLSDVGVSLNLGLPVADTSAILAWARPVGSRHVPEAFRRGQEAHLFFYLRTAF